MHNVVRAQIQIAVLVGENVSAWQRLTSDHIPFTVYTLAAKQVNIAKAFHGTRTPKNPKELSFVAMPVFALQFSENGLQCTTSLSAVQHNNTHDIRACTLLHAGLSCRRQ